MLENFAEAAKIRERLRKERIPEISSRHLKALSRRIRPVASITTLPMGVWPQDEVRTYFLRMPKDLRTLNFLLEPTYGRPIRLVRERTLTTYHTAGSAGRVFHPTIAEVMAQIPEECTRKDSRVIAFETFLEKYDPKQDEESWLHSARTVLLSKASPVNKLEKMRTHYM